MRYLSKLSLLAALGAFLLGVPSSVTAQTTSTCDRALGEAFLDVNNVRARILNTGGLFWRGEPHVYEVPKGSGSNAIFTSGIWIAGKVGGQLRASATRYGEWEMWAGPLDDAGNPPDDCSIFDRVYKISRTDIDAFDLNGSTIPDLVDWPTGLGAPTLDANGDAIDILDQPLSSRIDRKINLGAGERPGLLGDQIIWWVMNDRGNQHTSTDVPPIGLEVHGTAFAFDVAGDIGNATFYKFKLFYKGTVPLEESYLAIWSDPDLGNFDDDWVGSDVPLGLGYVYNSDNVDEGSEGYGTPVPAAGYDFFQGPIVPSVGDTAHVSGVAVPGFKNLEMSTFAFWNNGGGVQGGPRNAEGYYNYMRGFWIDGLQFTEGGSGRGFSEIPTNFMFNGDPAVNGFWTERNSDGLGTSISPGDRRFAMSTGPFTINPGDVQEIVFGLIWALGADNFDSVNALRRADALAQAAFDVNFILPTAPARPIVKAIPGDGSVTIEWTNSVNSNNYLESYTEIDPFAPLDDADYFFEGYKVIQYKEATDQVGTDIATYDVVNGITQVIDGLAGQTSKVTARGTDAGVSHTHVVGALTNSKTYYFGIQAYAYNEGSSPKVFDGPVARFEVIPRRTEDIISEQAIEALLDTTAPTFIAEANAVGQGVVTANVVSPGSILENATYVTTMYEMEVTGKRSSLAVNPDGPDMDETPMGPNGRTFDFSAAKGAAETAVTYDIDRTHLQQTVKVFDGNIGGQPAPLRENVILIDGLQFSVTGPAPGMLGFKMIANAAGTLDPPDMAAFAFNSSGFPRVEGRDRPEGGRNQSTNGSTWGIHVGGGSGAYGNEAGPFNSGSTWVGRSIREGSELNPWPNVGSDDYEWRFTADCFAGIDGSITEGECVGWRGFGDGAIVEVPFELWDTGTTSDPADDFRMLPLICEIVCTGDDGHVDGVFDIAGDHPISGGTNDPFSDWIYWYKPEDNGASPGEAGYQSWFFGPGGLGDRVFSRQVLVNWNGGSERPYDADLPEAGSVIQYNTKKPNQPGDTFTFNTAGFGTVAASDSLKKSRLSDMNVIPNPYLGVSDYERSQLIDEVRFSNLPLNEEATLRVYTLNGSLITTLFKPAGTNQLTWNLTTENNLPIGSGFYLIHVTVPGVGTHVIKFAAVKKRIQLNVF